MPEKKEVINKKIGYFLSKRLDYPFTSPANVTLTLNYVCNQNCLMCDIKKHKFDKEYEITGKEIKSIIDEMVELGIPELVLTGGEPFLHKDIFEVIEYAKSRNRIVVMITNGFYGDDILSKVIASKADHYQISLDGSTKEIYDLVRGVPGSFDIVISNIKKLVKSGKNVGVTATIVGQNYRDLLNIAKFAQGLGCSRLALRPAHSTNADPLSKSFFAEPFWIPQQELGILKEVIDELKEFNAATNYIDFVPGLDLLYDYFKYGYIPHLNSCYIGFTRLIISYNEKSSYEVWMCGGMAGDIRKERLRDIWYGKKARCLRKQARKCKQSCLFPEIHEPDLKSIFTLSKAIYRLQSRSVIK